MLSAKEWSLCWNQNMVKTLVDLLLSHNPEAWFQCLSANCSNSIANTLELLQSCTKPSIYSSPAEIYHCLATGWHKQLVHKQHGVSFKYCVTINHVRYNVGNMFMNCMWFNIHTAAIHNYNYAMFFIIINEFTFYDTEKEHHIKIKSVNIKHINWVQ